MTHLLTSCLYKKRHALSTFAISLRGKVIPALFLLSFMIVGKACVRTSSPVAGLTSAIALGTGIAVETIPTHDGVVRVRLLSDALVHVETSASLDPAADPRTLVVTPMVAATTFAGPTAVMREETAEGILLRTKALAVSISKADGCVRVDRVSGATLLESVCATDIARPLKGLEFRVPHLRAAYGLGQNFQNPQTSDGDLRGRVLDPGPFGNELRGFSGGANSVNQFPVIHAALEGTDAFAVFLDNPYRQRWDVGTRGWDVRTYGDVLRYFVTAAPDLASNRRAYMALTGTSPVPPRKAFGLWVSEFGYDSWDEIAGVRAGLEAAGIPFDGFVLDLQWFGGSFFGPDARMGTLRFDERPGRFPDAEATVQRFARDGLGLILIEESYVDSRLPEHATLAEKGFLVRNCAVCEPSFLSSNPWWGKGGMLDWSNPEAADWWHDTKREPLVRMGVVGHWTDLGEPEMYDPHGWYYGFSEQRLHAHADVHNLYALLWTAGIRRGYDRNAHARRPFILSRAGTSGIQRTGAALWSGDIGANLGALKAQANAQMQMTFSGVDYYGSDAGGFHRYSLDGDVDALYTQWFAQSAILDLPLRPHAWNTDGSHRTSPAAIGHVPSNRANAVERYRLFPYLYSLAHAASEAGDPIIAPPILAWPDDPELEGLGHEKLVGPSLLAGFVADYAGTARSFYFPNAGWYDFRTGRHAAKGPAWEPAVPAVDARGLFALPLFARDGAIVPLLDAAILDAPADLQGRYGLTMRVFPSRVASTARFTLREDDGTTVAYGRGEVARTRLEATSESGRVGEVIVGETKGRFEGMGTTRPVTLEIALGMKGGAVAGINVGGIELPACGPEVVTALGETREPRARAHTEAPAWRATAPCYVATPAPGTRFVVAWLGDLPRDAATTITLRWRKEADGPRPATRDVLIACDGARTNPGEAIFAVGSHPSLGAWDLARSVRLEPVLYPRWARLVEDFAVGSEVQWKCVKLRATDRALVEWQAGPNGNFRVEDGRFPQPVEGRF